MDRDSLDTWASESRASDADSSVCPQIEMVYKPGDILLTCKPFVHVVIDEMKGRICDLCLRPDPNRCLRCCENCEQIYFCNSCLLSQTPSIFKQLHLLECPIYVQNGKNLSTSSKLFLRLYLRLNHPESFPHQTYANPLTKEEITFESLVPRIVYNSQDEMIENIKSFCEENNLKLNNRQANSSDKKNAKKKGLHKKYEPIGDFHLNEDDMSVEEIAIFQFINLLDEFSKCESLVPLITDDLIYHLWVIFLRLWSYMVPISDEITSGLFFADTAIAYGLYLEPNVITYGHSCLPNTALIFYGPVAQLRAMKTIYSGDSLTTNMVSISISDQERLHHLRCFFISKCYCARCSKSSCELIDFKTFHSLKDELVSAFLDEFSSATNKSMNLSAILNFRNTVAADDLSKMYGKCIRIHDLCKKLYILYEQIYPHLHPEKSRFLFAYCATEMNLLLFQLEGASTKVEEESTEKLRLSASSQNLRISDCSEFSAPSSHLDHLTNKIHKWSDLLKITVKNIRWTHGVDHRLFREMPIPLSSVWRKTLGSRPLTLHELHSDPTVLLRILCTNTRGSQNIFFRGQMENLTGPLKTLLSDTVECASLASKCCPTVSRTPNSSPSMWRILGRILLVIFSILFPFFIYYTAYVDEDFS